MRRNLIFAILLSLFFFGQIASALDGVTDPNWYRPYTRDHVGVDSLFYMNGTWISDDKKHSEVWVMQCTFPYALRRTENEDGLAEYELINFVQGTKKSAMRIRKFIDAEQNADMTKWTGKYITERNHRWQFSYTFQSNAGEVESTYDCRNDDSMDLHLVKKQNGKDVFAKVIHLNRLTKQIADLK
jgi:hypothetical protein